MKVYIGLPEHLIDNTLWVVRELRINPLSHIEGGSDVVIEYQNLSSYGYDWIKYPSRYINEIFRNYFETFHIVNLTDFTQDQQLKKFKEVVFKIFARKYDNIHGYENQPFEEIWNSETATQIPVKVLKKFDYVNISDESTWLTFSESDDFKTNLHLDQPFPF